MLVLSHVKGHSCSGMGGAIKHLGMGAVTKKSKGDIHQGGQPKFVKDCEGCGACVKVCPGSAIEVKDGKAIIDFSLCWGCSTCVINCPYKSLEPKVGYFDNLLAQAD